MIKIFHVVGARPNFMKVSPIWAAFDSIAKYEQVLIHTGQHYDLNMSDIFFKNCKFLPQRSILELVLVHMLNKLLK